MQRWAYEMRISVWSSDVCSSDLSATFDASGQGIGAVEARIATFDGDPTTLTEFVPSRRQYLNAQGAIGDDPFAELLISARMERIRHAEPLQSDDGGIAAPVAVGDGDRKSVA